MQTGHCQCGQLTYEFTGDTLTCYGCHCTDCQAATGSAFTLSMVVARDDVTVTGGSLAVNTFDHNGNELNRSHCANCGSTVWFSATHLPELLALKPGGFDDKSWFEPVAHVWVRSAAPWLTFSDDQVLFQEQPEISELIDLWQERQKRLASK